MAIDAANLKFYLSGGASNTDPDASLGGARSTTQVGSGLANLFANVTGDQATSGLTDYRCVYFRNEDADTDGLISPVLWIATPTGNAQDAVSIGLDPAGKNATATTIASETDTPTGVTFTAPTTKAAGLSLPTEPYDEDDYVALWIKRVVSAGASSVSLETVGLRIEGDTL